MPRPYQLSPEPPYDGATDISALDLTRNQKSGVEAWLLFSDGLDTLQQSLPKLDDLPVFPVVSQSARNNVFLSYVAEKSGGMLLDLNRFAVEEACRQILTPQIRPRVKEYSGCEDIRVLQQDGRLVVSGKLTEAAGVLRLAVPGTEEIELHFNTHDAVEGNILARQWAGRKIQELAVSGNQESRQANTLANRYGIVSPDTSLLVLESLEQYVEYGIEPPASLAEMRAQFHTAVSREQRSKKEEQKEHLDSVVKLWQERVEWWEKDHLTPYFEERRRDENHTLSTPRRQAPPQPMSEDVYSCEDRVDECLEEFNGSQEPSYSYSMSTSESILNDYPSHDSSDDIVESDSDLREQTESTITVEPWNPKMPYLRRIKNADQQDQYTQYLKERNNHFASPSFFLDCGDYFLASGQIETGIRILSNLLEMQLEDVALMRIYGWRLQQAGELDEAIRLFEKILQMRDDEPQSYRDLALALVDRWEQKGEKADAVRAMELLYSVVSKQWQRFPEIEIIALMELNRLIHLAEQKSVPVPDGIDPRLRKLLDLDIRISLSWDADLTDVDLHLFEPNGDRAYYGHPETVIGGLVSRDFRDGYGPEEYVLKKAIPGTYTIKANYFASHQQSLCGPCTVIVNIFTNYGRPEEKNQVLTLRLEESGQDSLIGEITIEEDESTNKNANALQEIESFRKIKAGMNMGEVIDLVGSPDRVDHDEESGILILSYSLPAKVEMRVAMKHEVVYVHQIMEGAVVELL